MCTRSEIKRYLISEIMPEIILQMTGKIFHSTVVFLFYHPGSKTLMRKKLFAHEKNICGILKRYFTSEITIVNLLTHERGLFLHHFTHIHHFHTPIRAYITSHTYQIPALFHTPVKAYIISTTYQSVNHRNNC